MGDEICMGNRPLYIVSACLVGLKTRYDCQVKASSECMDALEGALWIPVCPEQLGGLSTPREPADLIDGDGFDVLEGMAKVIARNGKGVTKEFLSGAQQVLAIAEQQEVEAVYLKSKSPSCGLTPKIGVTAALLKKEGFLVREF